MIIIMVLIEKEDLGRLWYVSYNKRTKEHGLYSPILDTGVPIQRLDTFYWVGNGDGVGGRDFLL